MPLGGPARNETRNKDTPLGERGEADLTRHTASTGSKIAGLFVDLGTSSNLTISVANAVAGLGLALFQLGLDIKDLKAGTPISIGLLGTGYVFEGGLFRSAVARGDPSRVPPSCQPTPVRWEPIRAALIRMGTRTMSAACPRTIDQRARSTHRAIGHIHHCLIEWVNARTRPL